MSTEVGELVKTVTDAAMDAPASCPHRFVVLVCAAHVSAGALCQACAFEHLLSHTLADDATCALCGVLGPTRPSWALLPEEGEFTLLLRLCVECTETRGRRSALSSCARACRSGLRLRAIGYESWVNM